MIKYVIFLLAAVVLSACSFTSESEADETPSDLRVTPLDPDRGTSPSTPIAQRIASVLQEAKQQYDDRNYAAAMQWASSAENLIREHEYPDRDLALSIIIQGYCLLQAQRIEPYFLRSAGRQPGAIERFLESEKLNPDDLRARLGIGLALFRLHADKVRKAEWMDNGMLALEALEQDLNAATDAEDPLLILERARRRHRSFQTNRQELLKLEYVFRDFSKAEKVSEDQARFSPWIAGMQEGPEALKLADVGYTIEDAQTARSLTVEAAAQSIADLKAVSESWRKARQYWRMEALKNLQSSRDMLLEIRRKSPTYLWVERDLVFIYQSLGAYFLDIGLEQARDKARAAGTEPQRLSEEAQRLYLSDDFESWEKKQSRVNYSQALEFTRSFVRRHREEVEQARIGARDRTEVTDINTDPFNVDLAVRYRATMDDLITEERNIRYRMALEAAAMCIEPLFQLDGDVRVAETWARELEANNPANPIHHFVRATAYFQDEQYQRAIDSYDAFLKASSITADLNRRDLARARKRQCQAALIRSGSAGEN